MGAATVDHFVPHRARHGYGLSPRVIEAVGGGRPGDLIVTVDNGIASVAGVESAHAAGWQVLVCDHHLPGEQLPAAEALKGEGTSCSRLGSTARRYRRTKWRLASSQRKLCSCQRSRRWW